MIEQITSHSLTWPKSRKRSKIKKHSQFGKVSISRAIDEIIATLGRMGCPSWNVIISTNVQLKSNGLPYSGRKSPDDSGVSIWWRDTDGSRKVMAIDKYNTVQDNLWAVHKTLEAMRGIVGMAFGHGLKKTCKGGCEQ